MVSLFAFIVTSIINTNIISISSSIFIVIICALKVAEQSSETGRLRNLFKGN